MRLIILFLLLPIFCWSQTTATKDPTSDVSVTGTWTQTAGTRYLFVNDYADASSSNINCSGATGTIVFGFGSSFTIPTSATGIIVRVRYVDNKTASQGAACGAIFKAGSTTSNASAHNPSTTATTRADETSTNPATGVAWTAADINGTSGSPLNGFGINVTDGSPSINIWSIRLEVQYTATKVIRINTY